MTDPLAEDTDNAVAAALPTSGSASVRDARAMYSVSWVSFGAEHGRPRMY